MTERMNLDDAEQRPRPSIFKQRLLAQRQAAPSAPESTAPPLPTPEPERRRVSSAHERCVYTICTPSVFGSIHFNNDRVMITYVGDTTKLCCAFRYECTEGDEGLCIAVDASKTQFETVLLWPLGCDVVLELRTVHCVRRARYRNETPSRLEEK